ncbi:hypothetical protein ACLOJK_014868, partial [Asimina triloba]
HQMAYFLSKKHANLSAIKGEEEVKESIRLRGSVKGGHLGHNKAIRPRGIEVESLKRGSFKQGTIREVFKPLGRGVA